MKTNVKLIQIGGYLLLVGLLFLAFWIRIQGVESVPSGQFTGTDAYLYYWQAQIISDQGKLPARDFHRWLPLGRDLGQTLNLYSYVLAHTYKVVAWVFSNVTLYDVTIYMPVICFCIGLSALCLYLHHSFGFLFSSTVGVLLATIPGSIERSTAGFGDRDAWCLMVGILSVITYLTSLQTQKKKNKFLWTIASGFFVFLGGISWEGFGVFLSIILVVELWRFLNSETENGLSLYLFWILTFIPLLYLASPAYRNGYGFAKHLFAFMLVPPIVLLGARLLRLLLLSKVQSLQLHGRTLALGLFLAVSTFAISYVFTQMDTFDSTTVPFSRNLLMQNISELSTPDYNYWVFRYGSIFFIGSLGIISVPVYLEKKWGLFLALPLVPFVLTTFFQEKLTGYLGQALCNNLFFASIVCIIIGFLIVAWKRNKKEKAEYCYIASIAWFLLWIILARNAVRYDFFLGVPIAFFTAIVIQFLSEALCLKLNVSKILKRPLKIGMTFVPLVILMYWTPAGAHAKRSIFTAQYIRQAHPGDTPVTKALNWIKSALPNTAVVAAYWHYGSQLNVLGGVKTITDQDHYIQNWIFLYNRYVHHAANERELLEFLRAHGATHLMFTQDESTHTLLRRKLGNAFKPIYPKDNFVQAPVKIWEVRYPSDIKLDLKYLKTDIREIDIEFQFQ